MQLQLSAKQVVIPSVQVLATELPYAEPSEADDA